MSIYRERSATATLLSTPTARLSFRRSKATIQSHRRERPWATVEQIIEDGIATVTFTNPPKGFLTSDMVTQLGEIMTTLENDPAVRVIIFTGGLPDVFIRHFSVEEIIDMAGALKAGRAQGLPEPRFARTPLRRVWEQVDNCQKPTIAAINGYCGGGGCELTLCCDIRLAGPGDYTIGQMEILVGLLPGAGGTTRLARVVGTSKALEWVLRGRTFYPEEAAQEGLVHHYVEGDVLAAARTMARRVPRQAGRRADLHQAGAAREPWPTDRGRGGRGR